MSDQLNAREVKKVIEASIFNPTMRRDAKDFVDAQEKRIEDLETALAKSDPWSDVQTGEDAFEFSCLHCGVVYSPVVTNEHKPDCIWQLAKGTS